MIGPERLRVAKAGPVFTGCGRTGPGGVTRLGLVLSFFSSVGCFGDFGAAASCRVPAASSILAHWRAVGLGIGVTPRRRVQTDP